MNFDNFFIDMAPTIPTFYDDLGLATEGLLAESSSSTRDGGDQAIFDFPGLNFGGPLVFGETLDFGGSLDFGMGNVYAPFDGPSIYSYDPLLGGLLWNTDKQPDQSNSGLSSTSSGPGTEDVASGHAAGQTKLRSEREFALDISNAHERVEEPLPQPLPGSSSSVSPAEVETPTNSSYTEENGNTSTASSSPAGKSAKQRRSAASSVTSEAEANEAPSGTDHAEGSTPRGNIPCLHEGCTDGPFYCISTRNRHILSIHLGVHSECPGCRGELSRKDSLKRHLETTPMGSHCRVAAKANGWREYANGKMSLPRRMKRAPIVTRNYGRS